MKKFWLAVIFIGSSLFASIDFSPKSTSLISLPGYSHAIDEPLAGWDDNRLLRVKGESDIEFASRVNQTIYGSYYHCNYSSITSGVELLAALIARDSFSHSRILGS